MLLAPVTEAAVKAFPALLLPGRRWIQSTGAALWAGTFLGLGFGLGEIWYVAWTVGRAPQFADIPWYGFTGFLTERVLVTYLHGVMTAVCLSGAAEGKAWRGYLWAVGLHAFVNLGAHLLQMGVLPRILAESWIIVPVVLLTLLLLRMYRRSLQQDPPKETVLFRRAGNE